MASEMVDRVAVAIRGVFNRQRSDAERERQSGRFLLDAEIVERAHRWDGEVARAAISAMREPTGAMLAVVTVKEEAVDVWQTMIDVALKKPPPEPAG